MKYKCRFSFHEANANQVWPGTYRLADFIMANQSKYSQGKLLELGSATGVLAIFLKNACHTPIFDVYTTDFNDHGVIEDNIKHNFALNGTAYCVYTNIYITTPALITHHIVCTHLLICLYCIL